MDYKLALPFDRDSVDFARGVEVGMVWNKLSGLTGDMPVRLMIHGDNTEMAIRMAETLGLAYRGEDLGDDWIEVEWFPHPDAANAGGSY